MVEMRKPIPVAEAVRLVMEHVHTNRDGNDSA